MDKIISVVSVAFAGVGSALLLGAIFVAFETKQFVDEAVTVTGEVVSLEEKTSSGSTVLYAPVFQFKTVSGQDVVFRSSSASSPPSYDVGQTVEIAYSTLNPRNARETSFLSLWGIPLVFGGLGSVFSLIGGGTLYRRRVQTLRDETLKRNGVRVQTDFQNVERNQRLTVNGRSPWRIVTQWKNPASGEIHLFQSKNLWFDPTGYIDARQIVVYLDPKNPKHFYMDVSFLPQLAS